jgi:hypothetical protein
LPPRRRCIRKKDADGEAVAEGERCFLRVHLLNEKDQYFKGPDRVFRGPGSINDRNTLPIPPGTVCFRITDEFKGKNKYLITMGFDRARAFRGGLDRLLESREHAQELTT